MARKTKEGSIEGLRNNWKNWREKREPGNRKRRRREVAPGKNIEEGEKWHKNRKEE